MSVSKGIHLSIMAPLTNKHAFLIILAVLVLGGLVSGLSQSVKHPMFDEQLVDFELCVNAGGVIMESYPGQCRTKDGRIFVQDIGNELEKQDLILSTSPRPGDTVKSPLIAMGQARGYWFFEASFPVYVLNDKEEIIGVSFATADGEWMTEDFVPFSAEVKFDAKGAKKGFVILKKDNPSGLPEHDNELRIPVKFE